MPIFDPIRLGSSAAGDSYEIDRSLRFNDNDQTYLERTPSSDSNRTTMTLSVWVKRANAGEMMIMESFRDDANRTRWMFDALNRMQMFQRFQNNSHPLITEAVRRDSSAWMHLVWSIDTTQSTSSNRVKMYINGEQQSFISGSNSQPDQNEALFFNKDERHTIGVGQDSGGLEVFFDGYMAEMNFIDGQQLPPSSFAETDAVTGEYKAIEYDGSYGTNGFYLNFSDNSSTSALGTDSSGNGNNYSTNNFSVSSGVGNDSVTDTPTNNWATMSPNIRAGSNSPTYTNGNLSVQGPGSGIGKCGATFGLSSGKWYVEAKITHSGSNLMLGIINANTDYDNNEYLGSGSDFAIAADCLNKKIRKEGSDNQTSLGGMQNGDILAFAVDMDNGTFQLYNNGSTKGSSVSFTVANYSPVTFAQTTGADTSKVEWNFGQQGFTYTPPTGFKAVNSQNLPVPTAPKGSKYFDALLYTGNGSSSHAITGLDFSPDWVWIKGTSGTNSHAVFDTVRGATKRLGNAGSGLGNTTESTVADSLKSFDSNGFTFGNENGNNNGENYVAWCWDAGSSTVSNTDGGITSQVRASTTAGFSIISYTGTGSQNTVGHGLGVKPKIIITKNRSHSQDWFFYPKQITGNGGTYIKFNTSDNVASDIHTYPDVEPTSTVYTIGGNDGGDGTNGSGKTYIAYAFAEIEGYSAFGQFDGNGNSDGQFIYTGLRPRYLMIRRTNSGNHWVIYDSARSTFNVIDDFLRSDTNDGNSTSSQVNVDFYANGFKMRSGFDIVNAGSGTYFYMAFAENAFKYARAF